MRVLRFSHDYILNTGGMMTHLRGLNRELARECGVEIDQAFLCGYQDIKRLRRRGRIIEICGRYFQLDAMVNLFPCLVPQRSPGQPEMDDERTVALFERDFERLLDERCPDILHVHLVKHRVQLRSLQIAAERGIPIVMTHHEGVPETSLMNDILQEAARIADRAVAISAHAAAAMPDHTVDYQGFFVDAGFWAAERVKPDELKKWIDKFALRASDILIVYPSRFIIRKNHTVLIEAFRRLLEHPKVRSLNRTVRLVLLGPTLEKQRPYRSDLKRRVMDLGLADVVTFLESATRQELRALYHRANIVVYPAYNEGAGRSHLEGMLLGCCAVVANDAGLVEYVRHGENGLTFSPDSTEELADALVGPVVSEGLRVRLAAAGRRTASQLTLARYAADHVGLYESLLRPAHASARLPTRPTSEAQAENFISDAVLIVDLDQTLITPGRSDASFPTPFPPGQAATVTLECELHRRYAVRIGLDDLAALLALPWKARVLLSRSAQEKVSECARALLIGSARAQDLFDACVGAELIDRFSHLHGIATPFVNTRCVSNPSGRAVRPKPLAFARLASLREIGAALRDGETGEAQRLLEADELRGGRIVAVDDKPFYATDLVASEDAVVFPVVPYGSFTKFKELFVNPERNSALSFNAIEPLWVASFAPFGYLRWALENIGSWEEFGRLAGVEMRTLEGIARTRNKRQQSWVLDHSYAAETYRRYRTSSSAPRPDLGTVRLELRLAEHACVYRTLIEDFVARDVADGALVLFLGRDMDYAYEAVKEVAPQLANGGGVALMALSREAAESASQDVLVQCLVTHLPGLTDMRWKRLVVYDVGYVGRIVAILVEALRRDPRTAELPVEARLLNVDPTTTVDAPITEIEFESPEGPRAMSRELGLSIEALPHRTGCLQSLRMSSGEVVAEVAPHCAAERERALRAERILRHQLARGRRLPARGCKVSRTASMARTLLKKSLPECRLLLLQGYRDLLELATVEKAKSVQTVVYPMCGVDVITPFFCFPSMTRLILVDRNEADRGDAVVPPGVASEYLARIISLLARSPSPSRGALDEALRSMKARCGSLSRLHGSALTAANTCLSLIGFPLCGRFVRYLDDDGDDVPSTMQWLLARDDRGHVRVSYVRADFRATSESILGPLGRIVDHGTSAVVVSGSQRVFNKARTHDGWARLISRAPILLHDGSLLTHEDELPSPEYSGLSVGGRVRSLERTGWRKINPQSALLQLRAR